MTDLDAASEAFPAGRLTRALAAAGVSRDDLDQVVERYVTLDTRGFLLMNSERQVLAMNDSARALMDYHGALPRAVADVAHDLDLQFAVGEAIHDRHAVSHESFMPVPHRLLAFHIIPVISREGDTLTVLATVEDITRLRQLETVRRDFVANVSHELRTPIASINLLVETLQRGAMNDPAAGEHFLHRIQIETQAMAQLVEELLDLSRLESGILSLELESVPLDHLIDGVVRRLQPAAEEKGVEVIVDAGQNIPLVRVDPGRLEQVLMNLIHNAIKFTPAEGSVTIRLTRQALALRVEVIDTGVGMDAGDAARVFERFYKVDKGRNRAGGAGLGLAIVKHLLELHGSQLQVVSEVGRGSRFSFLLPVAD